MDTWLNFIQVLVISRALGPQHLPISEVRTVSNIFSNISSHQQSPPSLQHLLEVGTSPAQKVRRDTQLDSEVLVNLASCVPRLCFFFRHRRPAAEICFLYWIPTQSLASVSSLVSCELIWTITSLNQWRNEVNQRGRRLRTCSSSAPSSRRCSGCTQGLALLAPAEVDARAGSDRCVAFRRRLTFHSVRRHMSPGVRERDETTQAGCQVLVGGRWARQV